MGFIKRGPIRNQMKLRRTSLTEFTQADINSGVIIYVIRATLNITSDSFEFDVFDAWGNVLRNQRFNLSWARVDIGKSFTICEGVQEQAIPFLRFGNINTHVSMIMSVTHNMNEGTVEYRTNSNEVQIDSGQAHKKWFFTVPDNQKEGKQRKIEFQIRHGYNYIAGRSKITVKVLDANHKYCSSNGTMIKTKKSKRRKSQPSTIHRPQRLPAQPSTGSRRIKYGKLGTGVRVTPASFYQDKSQKIWKYHALIPITIDEAEEHELSQSKPIERGDTPVHDNKPFPTTSTDKRRPNEETINDAPSNQQNLNLFDGRVKVGNTNITANIKVVEQRRKLVTVKPKPKSRKESSAGINFPRKCNVAMEDRLHYEPVTRVLYTCNGAHWVPWSPAKVSTDKLQHDAPTQCPDGWDMFEKRCFIYVEPDGFSWNSAQRTCVEHYDGHLVSITSKKHLRWLRKLTNKRRFWTGLNRKFDHKTWEWSDQAKVTYTNWKRKHPKRPSKRHVGMDCSLVLQRKRWVSTTCDDVKNNTGLICMKDALDTGVN